MPRLRTARRFSSSCFSALIRADKIALIFSWSDQRSFSDMDSNSAFFADMLAAPAVPTLLTGCHIATPDINQGDYRSFQRKIDWRLNLNARPKRHNPYGSLGNPGFAGRGYGGWPPRLTRADCIIKVWFRGQNGRRAGVDATGPRACYIAWG